MSLVCNECHQDLGPGNEYPGREGVLVAPVFQALVYEPSKKELSFWLQYVESPRWTSVCFVCVEKGITPALSDSIRHVYEACELEYIWQQREAEQAGKFLSISDLNYWEKAHQNWKTKISAINDRCCLLCGDERKKDGLPYFVARVIDKLNGIQHPAGLFTMSNYSWSSVKRGSTSFSICFSCFRKHLPFTYMRVGNDHIPGSVTAVATDRKPELVITQGVVDTMVAQYGKPKADQMIKDLKKTSRVVIRK